jgi:hypothetical protein
MRAVVVYESMFGNTHEVATQIGDGLRQTGAEVRTVRVAECTDEVVRSAQLLVVGGPTHVHTMTRPRTRVAAVNQAAALHRGAQPGADGPGIREWLDGLSGEWLDGLSESNCVLAAAFDTRQNAPKVLTGQASRVIRSRLGAMGFTLIAPANSFVVDKQPQLVAGERERALVWGRILGQFAMSRLLEHAHT